jgi:tetratricopeptide (TPR) repeat protein
MHPTIFQLNAFGRCRLPAVQGRAVLRHLRAGCARCRAALSTHLTLWLDEGPAAEARAADPRHHGRALVAEVLRAATSAFRAAAKLRTAHDTNVDVDQALALLEAEGPAAIGRMPRRLLGPAVVEALLHLTVTLGARDSRLRLRFAELACDLAHRATGEQQAGRELRCRAAVELANAHRVFGDLRRAQEELDHARAELLRGPHDPLVTARLLVIQGVVMTDRWSLGTAQKLLSAATRIYRRRAMIQDLAQAGVSSANVLSYGGKFDDSLQFRSEVVQVLDRERDPAVFAATLYGTCFAMLEIGRWREALHIVRRERTLLTAHTHGRNASRAAQIEGRLLHRAGDVQGSDQAFASSRDICASQAHLYEAGVASLFWAAALEERGDCDGSRARIMEGTQRILNLNPGANVYGAVMLLRTTRQFFTTRDALPLDRVIAYLQRAEFNPDLRLDRFLS